MKGIYILTCRPTKMSYVGQSVDLEKRLTQYQTGNGHNAIGASIQKYGFNAFDIETIHYPHVSCEALDAIERWHIARLDTYQNGYNLTRGGDTNPMDDPKVRAYHKKISGAKTAEMNTQKERREMARERNKKNWKKPEYREKISKATSEYNKKRWQDPIYRKRMSNRIKGNNNPNKRKENPNQLKLF